MKSPDILHGDDIIAVYSPAGITSDAINLYHGFCNLLIYNTLYKFLLVRDLNRFPMR